VSPSRLSLLVPCALIALLSGSVGVGEAGVVFYAEVLQDQAGPLFGFDTVRDIDRARQLGNGDLFIVTDDATIDFDNSVSTNFGVNTAEPVTYSHFFIAVPPVQEFVTLTLTIDAYSVSGGVDPNVDAATQAIQFLLGLGTVPDDPILVDGLFVGNLVPNAFVETTFETFTGNELLIGLLLLDNRLDLTIVPSGPGPLGIPDDVSIRRSQLTVHYFAPEPATLSLLGIGLLTGLSLAVRKQARQKARR
jgi:hypothetical protein